MTKILLLIFSAIYLEAATLSASFDSVYSPGGRFSMDCEIPVGGSTMVCEGTFDQHGGEFPGVGANRTLRVEASGFYSPGGPTVQVDLFESVLAFGETGWLGLTPHTPFGFTHYLLTVDGASTDIWRTGEALLFAHLSPDTHEMKVFVNLWAAQMFLFTPREALCISTVDWVAVDPSISMPPGEVPEASSYLLVAIGLLGFGFSKKYLT